MAQDPWDNVPVVRLRPDPRQAEREQAETRYRNSTQDTNPVRVLLPGEEGYAGGGTYLRDAGVVVRPDPWADIPVASSAPIQSDPLSAFASAAAEQIPFLDEAAAGFTGLLTGRPYSEVRALQQEIAADDRQNQALARNIGGVSGFASGLAVPGSAYIQGATGAARVGRAAGVGAAYGGLYGAGAADDSVSGRLSGLGAGALGGAVLGGGLSAGASGVQRLAGIAGAARGAPVRGNVEQRAASRILNTLNPQETISELGRLQSLGVDATLIDAAGGTTERLLRAAAAPAGESAEIAVRNAASRQANLRPEVMASTRPLASDPRSASAVRESLENSQRTLADTQYREPYAAPVTLTEDAIRALRGDDGRAAIDRALRSELARPNYDADVVSQLESLRVADLNEPPTVSGRALDLVRRNLRDMSANFMRGDNPDRGMAAAYAQRVEGVDSALDAAPGLVEARATFRNLAGAIEAIDDRPDVFTTDPRDFASWVRNLTPEQREAATVGVRQTILDRLGSEANAGVGALNRMAQSAYYRQNLSSLIGEEAANQYLGSIAARVQQTQRAARISPNTNSQTFGRLADENEFNSAEALSAVADVGQSFAGNLAAIGRTIERVRSRATMSPEERAEIVRLGFGSADDLQRIIRLADEARAAGRPVPRAVRQAVERVGRVAGPQAGLRFESVLLPSRVAAEEEEMP